MFSRKKGVFRIRPMKTIHSALAFHRRLSGSVRARDARRGSFSPILRRGAQRDQAAHRTLRVHVYHLADDRFESRYQLEYLRRSRRRERGIQPDRSPVRRVPS